MASEQQQEEHLENDCKTKGDEQNAKDLVEELYSYNQKYFLLNDVDNPSIKDAAVKKKMEETLEKLKQKEDTLPRPLMQYLCGKALNVMPVYSKEAEQMLSQSVKHDPLLVDAWNCLGESYWKGGNVQQAYHCFLGGLSHEKNKVSMRNLSMVLRQLGKDAEERQGNLTESLDKARDAVSLDVKDGTSWMVLGNAYLAMFFSSLQDDRLLQQSSNAYTQAEKDETVMCNPDLHFNKATLLLYEENYVSAIHHLEQACRFDPGWPNPRQKLSSIKDFLQSFSRAISSKGKLKHKRLATLQDSLVNKEKWVGKSLSNYRELCIQDLREGRRDDNKGEEVLVAGVAACVTNEDKVPFGCVLVDEEGDSVGVTLYNVSKECHFNIGDVFAIANPIISHTHIKDMNVDYDSIKVTQPRKVMLCNGRPLTNDKLSTSVAQVTAFS